jgi:hypothetical protein
MSAPASPHFFPLSLATAFNARRDELPEALRPPHGDDLFGERVIGGKLFAFGPEGGRNVVFLDTAEVEIGLDAARATYVLLVHAVADITSNYLAGFAESATDGNSLGGVVSDYTLRYQGGATVSTPVLRRFAIQQSRIGWGASPFAAAPAREDQILRTVSEQLAAAGAATHSFGLSECRHVSARDSEDDDSHETEFLWIYALPNPHPEQPLEAVLLTPRHELSAVYAVTLTDLPDHPLRPGVRRRVRLALPAGAALNAIGELDDVYVDLGSVISARAVLEYDADRWLGAEPSVQPTRSANEVVVDYVAHPAARLHVGPAEATLTYELAAPTAGVTVLPASERPVRVRVVDSETGAEVPVRLHMHGDAGEYLPPRGHHRKVNGSWFEDSYGEHVSGEHQYAYVDGDCIVDLPLGTVHVEITRGYEIAPLRRTVIVDAGTETLTFELERVLHWRERGWVTADTHVHFLSPQTALLEGKAEGVNVVNLLASQWGEMFSNVADFDGATTLGAKEFGGDGEFLVRVGSENRMQVLGHISLLGYSGALIHPLCTGGPSESALGDPLEVTMAEWARRCLDQRGLVVMPHAPNPQLERAADIVLDLVDAVELMIFNPLVPGAALSAYGLADWYRFLNLGHQIPLVGGSDKMAASMLLGGIRTYAHLGDCELTYESWMDAVRAGNTFATIGPLVSILVEGVSPGGRVDLPAGGGKIAVDWNVESVGVPIEQVEIVDGGLVVEQVHCGGCLASHGTVSVAVTSSTWLALRVRGSYHGRTDDIAAHTSAVQVVVDETPLFSEPDAATVLDQIQGAIAYVDTLAPRPEVQRYRELRATLEGAYNRLHQRMHHAGVYHAHPIHDPTHSHEH